MQAAERKSLCQLAPATDRLDDLADCFDYELRLLLMYFVAAVRVGDVLSIRHKPGEPLLRLFLRRIGDVAEVRRYVSRQLAFGDHRRDLRAPGSVRRQHDQGGVDAVAERRGPGQSCDPR